VSPDTLTFARPPTGQRRERILAAALDAFSERGYTATTIADVRERSGASVGSIYHHFGDKEGIAAALYVECLRDFQEGFLQALAEERSAERGIKAMVRQHLRWVEANPKAAAFLADRREAEVAAAADERVRELNRVTLGIVRDWLRPHVEAGRMRRMPLRLFYVVALGPAQEYTRHWLRDPQANPIGAAEPVLAQAAWDALRAPAGRRQKSETKENP
jgi:AcrR family transcriptional regulator